MTRSVILAGVFLLAAVGCDAPTADRARTNTETPHTTNRPIQEGKVDETTGPDINEGNPSGAPQNTTPGGQPGAADRSNPMP